MKSIRLTTDSPQCIDENNQRSQLIYTHVHKWYCIGVLKTDRTICWDSWNQCIGKYKCFISCFMFIERNYTNVNVHLLAFGVCIRVITWLRTPVWTCLFRTQTQSSWMVYQIESSATDSHRPAAFLLTFHIHSILINEDTVTTLTSEFHSEKYNTLRPYCWF